MSGHCPPPPPGLRCVQVHHLLQMRGSELFEWLDLTPQQAYFRQAQLLSSIPGLEQRCLALECIPEELQAPNKKLRMALCGSSGLKEQLDSVIPFLPEEQRIEATLEMIGAWSEAAPLQVPEAVKLMFG